MFTIRNALIVASKLHVTNQLRLIFFGAIMKTLLIVLYAFCFCYPQWENKSKGLPDDWIAYSMDADDSLNAVISVNFHQTGFGLSSLFKTTNGGDEWAQLPSPDNELIVDVDVLGEKIWGATDWGRLIYSPDGGQTWSVQFVDSSITDFMNYVEMFDEDNGIAMGDVYAGNPTSNPGPALFLKTTDGGVNWVSVNDSAFGGISGDTWRRLDFVSPSVGYFRESGGPSPEAIFKTTDGCNSWQRLTLSSNIILLKFYNEFIGVTANVSGGGTTVSRTTDGGINWQTFPLGTSWSNDFEFLPDDPDNIWCVDGDNLYFSSNFGESWAIVNLPVTQVYGRDLVFTGQSNMWLLCDGVVLRNANISTVLNAGENTAEIIGDFSLEQNYPNPFNPTTKIQFTLPSPSEGEGSGVRFSTLKIYDILGRDVSTLVNKDLAPGSYVVDFDAKDLGSGIYFYKLNAGSFTKTKKMIVLR